MTCLKFWVGNFLEAAAGAAPLRIVAILAGLLVGGEAGARQPVGGAADKIVGVLQDGVDLKPGYQLLVVPERQALQARPGMALLVEASPSSRLQRVILASAATKRDVEVLAQRGNREQSGEPVEVQPGMTATVQISTGSQTVLAYLTKPVTKTFSESLNER